MQINTKPDCAASQWGYSMKKVFLTLILLSFSQLAQAEQYLYILSAKAKLMAAPSFNAATIGHVSKGERLLTLEKKNNRWFKVEYKGKQGWISRLAVSAHPPMRRVSRLAGLEHHGLIDNARRRASSVTTTAAVRGLRPDQRARLDGSGKHDFQALALLEKEHYHNAELDRFLASRPQ